MNTTPTTAMTPQSTAQPALQFSTPAAPIRAAIARCMEQFATPVSRAPRPTEDEPAYQIGPVS